MKFALISVTDKTGLIAFANGLTVLGWQLMASGGTARYLKANGFKVIEVAEYTGSPEILGGRVKTLHPAIHAGILARDNEEDYRQLAQMGWSPIDLVVVNLYPFEETIRKPDVSREIAIEQIDIGGFALLRAAAKNCARVTVVCDPDDYQLVLAKFAEGQELSGFNRNLAQKAFRKTGQYDNAIANYMGDVVPELITLFPCQPLRYGENPHQPAELFGFQPDQGPMGGKLLHGKALSYNNLLDLDAAWRAVVSFDQNCVVIVKHLSPCGIACADSQLKAFELALASDPVSAFGGVVAANREVNKETAYAINKMFVECIIAPGFDPQAIKILEKKKNIRLLLMPEVAIKHETELRSIIGGVLRQESDKGDPVDTEWNVVTERQPDRQEMQNLSFAWKACQFVKSNGIVLAREEATVGIGGGQPNRVDCVRIAGQKANERAFGAVMASDAFFPFADSVEEAARLGVTAIIQPGGSIRDEESIQAANKSGISMVFTGTRHFRH